MTSCAHRAVADLHLLAVALAVGQEASQDDGRGPGAGEAAGDEQREAGEQVRQRRGVRLAAGDAAHLQLDLRDVAVA